MAGVSRVENAFACLPFRDVDDASRRSSLAFRHNGDGEILSASRAVMLEANNEAFGERQNFTRTGVRKRKATDGTFQMRLARARLF